jgi:hypothetical protein
MKRPLCALVLVLIAALPASAADEKAQPNRLTPSEITDGWILLWDGQTTFGWEIDGDAKVGPAVLILGGANATKAETTTAFQWEGSPDYALEMEIGWQGISPPKYLLPNSEWAILDDTSQGKIVPRKLIHKGAGVRNVAAQPLAFDVPAGSTLRLRSVKYRPLSLEPIFNGKDLSGWKEVPGGRSKFSVTGQGALNIKNGPGDIQTLGQWADFILQLDVIANGTHLNSGVFFRCLPGRSWSGYESQIRNQWEDDDRTKPVDYGTGGIYRRQPARKVVSSDRQWFTKTIIAQGNHIAVWVNGYQVSDFTDTRPLSDNARQGAKLDKGPISLQGHDPTTDLSFRNLRIAALPRQEKTE